MRLIDSLWARRIGEGNNSAFEDLIKKNKDHVFNYIFHLTSDYQIAEEIAQDVFIKAYQKIGKYDSKKSSLSTWIMAIAHNESLNWLRTKRSELPLEEEIFSSSSNGNPEEIFLTKEATRKLIDVLNTLSYKEKSIILLKDYFGYKLREIAEILNISEGTVKSTLHGSRLKIRERYGETND